ncbi:MAG: single-stranded-DNA-specific exonuclease RecJ [Bacteroidales bacterium]|nr:single-stranded-DNA-specific exonuclease RecJ [Bacteroidales bacterium]
MTPRWHYDPLTKDDKEAADRLARLLGVYPLTGRLLYARGIRTEQEAKAFFNPRLTTLHDPFLMNDMHAAVERINRAMGSREHILVYGDYDVDGCTAVALVYAFLSQYYSHIDYFIPNRYEEGYGVSLAAIDRAHAMGVSLIIVLDSGIKACEEIAYAQTLGIDFIVCDHHVPDDTLPPAVAVLNPKRTDNTYPCTDLSGCGVGFKLMQAFAINNGIEFSRVAQLLDLCAVSIAADLVPVVGENRILAYHGLRRLNKSASVGLRAIIEVCGLKGQTLSFNDIVFKIAPRINASGRIQSGRTAVALLVERQTQVARQMAQQINDYNDQRKDLDKQMTEEAHAIVEGMQHMDEKRCIVVYDPAWNKGVIGIVASRLTELHYRPTIVITQNTTDTVTGSVRSVPGFDIYKALESCRDLLINFGGHIYAAGMTLRTADLPEFITRFEAYVNTHIAEEQREPKQHIDAVIDFRDINRRLRSELKRFAPFGPGNPKPIFCTRQVYDYGTSKVVGRGQEHIKLELVDNKSSIVMNGIAFGQSAQAGYVKSKRAFDICYSVEDNTHKKGEVQLLIEQIRPIESI